MSEASSPNGPRTIQVPVNGTGTVSATLPPGVTLDVQTVYVEIDATAAGATSAELVLSEQSGVVIARKRQGETVDAGINGSATWAIRLDDSAAGTGPPSVTAYEAFRDGTGVVCPPSPTVTVLPFVHDFGAVLGGFFAGQFTITAAGTYALALWVNAQTTGPAYTVIVNHRVAIGGAFQAASVTAPVVPGLGLSGGGPAWSVTRTFAAGAVCDVRVAHNATGNRTLFLQGGLAKLG